MFIWSPTKLLLPAAAASPRHSTDNASCPTAHPRTALAASSTPSESPARPTSVGGNDEGRDGMRRQRDGEGVTRDRNCAQLRQILAGGRAMHVHRGAHAGQRG